MYTTDRVLIQSQDRGRNSKVFILFTIRDRREATTSTGNEDLLPITVEQCRLALCRLMYDAYIHPELMLSLADPHKAWLGELGIVEITDVSFFHRTIIPNASNFIRPDNALETIRQIFLLFEYGQILVNDLKKLDKLHLFTLDRQLLPADQLYLSAAYGPRLPLDQRLIDKPHYFLSPSYMQQNENPRDWYHFFLIVGVQETIGLGTIAPNMGLFARYRFAQMEIIHGIGSQFIHDFKNKISIQFLEETENNFNFARDFWRHVMETLHVRHLIRSEVAYWGEPGRRGSQQGTEVNN